MKKLISVILALALVLPAMPAAFAEETDQLSGIFAALTAEGSDYSEYKAACREYYPDVRYEETLESGSITINVSGTESMDGSYTFVQEGDYLTISGDRTDFTIQAMVRNVLGAVGDYYGMNTSLLNAYVSGLSALEMDSPYFKMQDDEAAGTAAFSIYTAGPYDMKELDRMVLTADVLEKYAYDPLADEFISQMINLGKVSIIANGSKDGLTILAAEYGELDELAYRAIINVAAALQPAGWEAFLEGYTELADAEAEEYTAVLNADEEAVREIYTDPMDGYSYAVVRIGNAIQETAEETQAGESEAEAAEKKDVQYVLYLGTNDKDTNKPVFTEAEAMEQAKAILIKHFGGYTIQEASGGWIDGDTVYQEYTLVIYLSDTTADRVHAAADELVNTFRQSSVMIQENPTVTEFYSPAQ